ncbi:MAG: GNAT family N-acetyltransferase, partial [Acidimicrobiia bacterium]
LAVVRVGGEIACAGIFSEVSGVVEYHLGGTAEAHRKLGPTRLLFHHMTRWAKSRGNRTLHLGGGVGAAEDSLFHFKSGFSPNRATFQSWRVVCDPVVVASASAAAGPAGSDGFFPPYRRAAKTSH